MPKYEIRHEWVKELGLTKGMAQVADSATDHIGHALDNTTLKDYAFMVSWITMAILLVDSGAIKKLMELGGKFEQFAEISTNPDSIYTRIMGSGSLATWGLNIGTWLGQYFTTPQPPTTEQKYPLTVQIGLAIVVSYFVLAQGTDILSAVLALGAKI